MIQLLDSADGETLALSIHGYRMFQATFADVLAMDRATTPCRLIYNGHAPLCHDDLGRDGVLDTDFVWVADTDRGPCTGWCGNSPGRMAAYLNTLPRKTE